MDDFGSKKCNDTLYEAISHFINEPTMAVDGEARNEENVFLSIKIWAKQMLAVTLCYGPIGRHSILAFFYTYN